MTNADIKFVQTMGNGWNLGNSLESICKDGSVVGLDLETYWKNPRTTKDMIIKIKEAGFQTIRIPVTWGVHMDATGLVDLEWMQRVKEVVNYAIEAELYVILNTHHEEWITLEAEAEAEYTKRFAYLWDQIGANFQEYDERLLFEGMNEPRKIESEEEWTGGSEETRMIVNRLNQVFVDTIRDAEGNNKTRYLLVPTYAASTLPEALRDFELPKGGRIILSVHAYVPYSFAMQEDGETEWKKEEDAQLDLFMKQLNQSFIQRGIPVIISEFGAKDKQNTKERLNFISSYTTKAREHGLMYIWWDEGGSIGETQNRYRLFDRETGKWLFEDLKEALIASREE